MEVRVRHVKEGSNRGGNIIDIIIITVRWLVWSVMIIIIIITIIIIIIMVMVMVMVMVIICVIIQATIIISRISVH